MIKVFVRSGRLEHHAQDGRRWPYQEIDVIYPGERNPISDRIFLDSDQVPFPIDCELLLDLEKSFYPGRFQRLSFRPRWRAAEAAHKPQAVK